MTTKVTFKKTEKGQGLVEYALISVLVGLGLMGTMMAYGPEIKVAALNLMDSFTGGARVENGELILPGMSPSSTPSDLFTPTDSPAPTNPPASTNTPMPSNTPTSTYTPTPTPSLTPTDTPTSTYTLTPTDTPTPSPTDTPTPTSTDTPTPTPTDTPTPTPTITPMPQWIDCATQNGYCDFTGTYAVRFGKNSTWVTQVHTDGVACTTAIFGNPIGGRKTCQVYK